MKVLGLFSGGKDSTFALYEARQLGHEISCLVTICPYNDSSMLFHYPNCKLATYLGEALGIPSLVFNSKSITKEEETQDLESTIVRATSQYQVDGLVHGAIYSRYQKQVIEKICEKLNIQEISPIWNVNESNYIDRLIEEKFEIRIVAVAAMGLDDSWLGVRLDSRSLKRLKHIAEKYRINLTFEGGDAETLVVDCPMYRKKLEIRRATTKWDGQRGIFEIEDAALVEK